MAQAAAPSPALVLFDIDGTLLRGAGPQHGQALVAAIRQVLGRETDMARVATQGMLDPDILDALLKPHGVPETERREALPEICRIAAEQYEEHRIDLRERICPGVHALLERLQEAGAVLGLVTGNLSRIGWRKMDNAGLRRYFRFGAFGEMAATRAELAMQAMQQAVQSGWATDSGRRSLIGDHANDMLAAKTAGLWAVGVATGKMSVEELQQHGADLAVPTLQELNAEQLLA